MNKKKAKKRAAKLAQIAEGELGEYAATSKHDDPLEADADLTSNDILQDGAQEVDVSPS